MGKNKHQGCFPFAKSKRKNKKRDSKSQQQCVSKFLEQTKGPTTQPYVRSVDNPGRPDQLPTDHKEQRGGSASSVPIETTRKGKGSPRPFGLQCSISGNLCFFYSLLQCLFNSPGLQDTLPIPKKSKQIQNVYPVLHELINEAHNLNHTETCLSVNDLVKVLQKPLIGIPDIIHRRGQPQKDSYEFFSRLIDVVHREIKEVREPAKQSKKDEVVPRKMDELNNLKLPNMKSFLINATAREALIQAADMEWFKARELSALRGHFELQTMSIIRCPSPSCRKVRVCSETMISLPVVLPRSINENDVTLQKCILEVYQRIERFDELSCFYCKYEGSKVRRKLENDESTEWVQDHGDMEKLMLLGNLPPCLLVHLLRFKYSKCGWGVEKNEVPVSIPMELDLSDIYLMDSSAEYKLYGVVVHYGTTSFGHYVSYIRYESKMGADSYGTRWYFINDSSVHEVPDIEVELNAINIKKNAYLLFYERSKVLPV